MLLLPAERAQSASGQARSAAQQRPGRWRTFVAAAMSISLKKSNTKKNSNCTGCSGRGAACGEHEALPKVGVDTGDPGDQGT